MLRLVTPILSPGFLMYAIIPLCVGYWMLRAVYNLYIHPLRHYPGPRLRAVSYIPAWWTMFKGDVYDAREMHARYGRVVRISPDCLSYDTKQAWRDIYGHVPGRSQIPKDATFYNRGRVKGGGPSIINAEDAEHSRFRRALSHAFSQTALREQEANITHFFDLMISKLDQISRAKQGEVDIVSFYNFLTFDITGSLVFGEPFRALENAKNHFFMDNIFRFMKSGRLMITGSTFPLFGLLHGYMMSRIPAITKTRQAHRRFVEERINTRIDNVGSQQKDLMSFMLRGKDEKSMSRTELYDTGSVLIVAGSETTATALSGATWLLLKHPETMSRLKHEIRSAFASTNEMTFLSCDSKHLPYLNAVIQEAMRWYPPGPGLSPRRTVVDTMIDGRIVPAGTSVGIHPWATNHGSHNFDQPDTFDPERWMPGTENSDVKDAFQPFSMGPRNCLGHSLAYAELTSTLARLLFTFDLELCPESEDWGYRQRAWVFWDKPAMFVRLSRAGKRDANPGSV